MRHRWVSLGLLVAGCCNAYVWWLATMLTTDENTLGQVWNLTGAGYRLLLLALVTTWSRSFAVALVAAVLAGFDLMVAGCSTMWLISPWPLVADAPLCSAKFHAPLGLAGAVIALAVVLNITREKRP